jgi:hypothetical protein
LVPGFRPGSGEEFSHVAGQETKFPEAKVVSEQPKMKGHDSSSMMVQEGVKQDSGVRPTKANWQVQGELTLGNQPWKC